MYVLFGEEVSVEELLAEWSEGAWFSAFFGLGDGLGLEDGECGLCAFFHDFAELSCEDKFSGARCDGGFDEEDLAADGGVGEARGDAGDGGAQGELGFVSGRA